MKDENAQQKIARLQLQVEELQVQNKRLSSQLQIHNRILLFQKKINDLFERPSETLDKDYQRVVELLPQAFQYPEQVCVLLKILGMEFGDSRAKGDHPSISTDIKNHEQIIGNIYVSFLGGADITEGEPFLDEEKTLLSLLAQRIVGSISREEDKDSPFHDWATYRKLYDSPYEVLFEISSNGQILFVSSAAKGVLGYDPGDLMGHQLFQFIHPDDAPRLFTSLETINLDNPSILEFRFLNSNGQYRWCRISTFTVLQYGEEVGVRGLLTDIDDIKMAELKAEQNSKMLDQLIQRMDQGVVYHDGDGNVIKANPAALSLLGFTMEQLQDIPALISAWHLMHEDGSRLSLEDYPPMRTLRTGMSIHDEVLAIVKSPEIPPTWVLASSEPDFREGESTPFQVFTTFTDITEIKEAKAALELQMKYTASILQAIPDGILIIDTSGRVLDYKPSVVNSAHLFREMFVGRFINEVLPNLDFESFIKSLSGGNEAADASVSFFEMMIEGVLHYLEAHMSRLSDDKIVAVVRDTTGRHKTQLALNESNRKMNVLMGNLKGVAFRARKDATWVMEFLSKGILDLTGYVPEGFLENRTRSFTSIIHEDDRTKVNDAVQTSLENHAPYMIEYRIHTAEGTCKWVWEKGQVHLEEDHVLYLEGFITDITDRKRVEEQLKHNEEKYRSLVESLSEAIVILDLDGTYHYVNAIFARDVGMTQEELVGLNIDQVFPQKEVKLIKKNIDTILKTDRGMINDAELHLVAGQERWFRVNMQPIHDENGKILTILVTSNDITVEREHSAELRKLSIAIEQSPMSIIVMDKDATIEFANDSACRLTGLSMDELIGNNPRFSNEVVSSDTNFDELWETVGSGMVWKGSILSRRKDGEPYWQSLIFAPVMDEENDITHYLVLSEDVTEKLKMQKALERNEIRLREVTIQSRAVVWEIDLDGVFTYVSPAVEDVYGYSSKELVGLKTFYDLYPEQERDEYKAYRLRLIQKRELLDNYDNPILRKDGSLIWVSSSAKLLYDDSQTVIGYRGVDFDIDQRKNDELELLKFKSISDQANYGNAIVDMEGNILYLNTYFAHMHGYEIQELLGRNLSFFHAETQLLVVNTWLERLKKYGEFSALEIWRKRKDGSEFPSLMNAKVLCDNEGRTSFMVANAIDITDMKQKEAAIRRLEIAIEQSPAALVITDLDAVITYVSPAFTIITGYEADEVIGQRTSILKSGKTSDEQYTQLWNTIESGNIWTGELINRRKNGELYNESMSITPIVDTNGNLVNYLAIKEDITDRKQVEDARIARESAEKANQAKSIFLSNMSHEIRTPLNAIIGFAQVLDMDSSLSPDQRGYVQTINTSSRHLLALINDILDISKIEAGKLVFAPKEFDFKGLLTDLDSMFSITAEKKGLELTIELSDSVPEFLFADEGKLRQLLINIIGNAVKFTTKGNVTIRVEAITMDDEDRLHVEVSDTGPGIPEEDLEFIFDTFHQSMIAHKVEGTGLGLAISKKLAEFMGGHISVESVVGIGSTFKFSIPFNRVESYTVMPKSLNNEIIGLDLGSLERRILVVDDNPINRELLKVLLKPFGFSIVEAENGNEAIEQCRNTPPHLIMMDLRMPVMDGYEATNLINIMYRDAHVPIIAVTASATEDEEKTVLEKGFDGYIRKPFNRDSLLQEIADQLDLRVVYPDQSENLDVRKKGSAFTKENMSSLPAETIHSMRETLEQGDMVGFKSILADLGVDKDEVRNQLMDLAKSYDYETLFGLLDVERGADNE